MTLETMAAVSEALAAQGLIATFEYPGFIKLTRGARIYHWGDSGDTWSADVYDDPRCDSPLGTIDTTISRESDDVKSIVTATINAINSGDAA